MSSKNSRHTPSPSPASPSPPTHAPSKLPKFLQKASHRDRAKSNLDATGSPSESSVASGSSASPEPLSGSKIRKGSKFLGSKDKDDKGRKSSSDHPPPNHPTTTPSGDVEEAPVIIEPVAIPRPRTRSERYAASAPETSHLPLPPVPQTPVAVPLYSSSSSTSRLGDLPTRLSGWFQHAFNSSSTDISIPNLINTHATSPKGKGPSSALFTAARHGKASLDRAMARILDSDAMPDKCPDPIWLLGVQHPGYEPPLSDDDLPPSFRRDSSTSPSIRSSTSSAQHDLSQSTNSIKDQSKEKDPSAHWPPVFYQDFTSRIWLTYRSQFSLPIRDGRLEDLCGDNWEVVASTPVVPVKSRPWHWVGGEKTWTSDAGWGCMLRTGQSLLANALIHFHLGRDWRRPPYPVLTADYATYVQILTWFLDIPSPEAPFSVHRMALAGKELGTDVGQWFGPSIAAGAIRTLVNQYPECGIGVSVATDSTLYRSQVYAASHGDSTSRSPRKRYTTTWGDRPVLLLVGIRLGIEGVNPIYYETIKKLYTFPQSVGIAGGRPSSSYYFVGSQADNLFYLDPHHTRPAIPLRPTSSSASFSTAALSVSGAPSSQGQTPRASTPQYSPSKRPTSPRSVISPSPLQQQYSTESNQSYVTAVTTSSTSASSSGDGDVITDDDEVLVDSRRKGKHREKDRLPPYHSPARSSNSSGPSKHGRWRSASASSPAGAGGSPDMSLSDLSPTIPQHSQSQSSYTSSRHSSSGLDPTQLHYCSAYSAAELKTFHCERVRKMPLSGLDPSMLLGFLVKDEQDWIDFRIRVGDLPKTIFSVQEEPPSWPSDSDDNMGLESISEPDDLDFDDEDGLVDGGGSREDDDEDEDGDKDQFFDTQSSSERGRGDVFVDRDMVASDDEEEDDDEDDDAAEGTGQGTRRRRRTLQRKRSQSEELDTEEDPVNPLTPGPGSKFDIIDLPRDKAGDVDPSVDVGDDIEDDWIDPSVPPSILTPRGPPSSSSASDVPAPPVPPKDAKKESSAIKAPRMSKGKSSGGASTSGSGEKKRHKSSSHHGSSSGTSSSKKSRSKQTPVPVPSVKIPSSGSGTLHPPQPEEQYPFPVTPADDDPASNGLPDDDWESSARSQAQNSGTGGKRMHTARARDGGRTQSGGVKGILTDD